MPFVGSAWDVRPDRTDSWPGTVVHMALFVPIGAVRPMRRHRRVTGRTRRARRLAVAALTVLAGVLLAVTVAPVALATFGRHAPGAPTATATGAPSPSAPMVAGSSSPPASPARDADAAVVGLGDSVPAGTACGCTNYVTLLGEAIAARRARPVAVTNFATDGQTTGGLLGQLEQPVTQRALARAAVVIVTIGANDFDATAVTKDECASPDGTGCFGGQLASLRSHLDEILAAVRHAAPKSQVLVTGYWDVFLDGQVGSAKGASYVANSDALTRQVNATVATAAARAGATYVDIYAPFKGDGSRDDTPLLASDGDHPDAQGHHVIAAALFESVS